MKRFLFFVFFILWIGAFLISKPVFASEEFEISHQIEYLALASSRMKVTQRISLTNKLANVYATQYSIVLQEMKIQNVRAENSDGALKTNVSQSGVETIIRVNFNQPMVGKGKTLEFTLNYEALDLAQKNGQIWEINIPKFSKQNPPDNLSLVLSVPTSFGQLAFLQPEPASREENDNLRLYHFGKDQLLDKGVHANFGEFQIFDFVLSYHLANTRNVRVEAEVALPPDTAFQITNYTQIDPEPLSIRMDNDGNWLAKYRLKAKEKINIQAIGQVKIFSQPRSEFPKAGEEILRKNLLAQNFWPIDDIEIKTRAQQLKTPRAIYDFVVDHLEYNFEKINDNSPRLGGLGALQNPKDAICMEFTDLFVTLARAAGIPAREINGFAYTTNVELKPLGLVSDILHAWPEFWDETKGAWVPVDPTWGKTTGGIDYFSKTDLNHFTFAIHGESDEEPYPAGSYKTVNDFGKDVQVVFAQKLKQPKPEIEVLFSLPGSITIKNKGTGAFYNLEPKIKSETLTINFKNPNDKIIPILPPYSQQKINFEMKPISSFNFQKSLVSVIVDGQKFSDEVTLFSYPWFLLGGLIFIILIFLTRPWNYVRKKRR